MQKIKQVEIKDFFYGYSGPSRNPETLAIGGIDLNVNRGEFVSIVGPSGCGKSTLLGCVMGLLKSNKGQILIKGKTVKKPTKNCAMVFQSHSLFPWRTVLGNITYGLEMQGLNKVKRLELGRKMIKMVNLEGFENYYPHQLSGGMQQRVNLARAWVMDPEVLLLDEPFASLDAQTRELMQLELLKIWQKNKKTVLFVTHQINEAVYLSDKVVVMTKRPGTIKEVVEIDIARPRALEIKLSNKFVKIERHIWKQLMQEVQREEGE